MGQVRLLLRYREMLILWTSRELRARYRQSIFGPLWALIQPVFQVLIISIIFGKFIRVPSDGFPYPVFLYVALLPWLFFAGSISAAVPSLIQNMNLVTKIYFPREILPLSAILARFVDFLIGLVVLLGLLLWYRIPLHHTIIFVPLLLVVQILFALGISLLGSVVGVFIRDVSFVLPYVLQLWMYLSPVIYPMELVPEQWKTLYMLNPMAGILESYREVLLRGNPPNLSYLGLASGLSFGLCFLAYAYFKKLERSISDVL